MAIIDALIEMGFDKRRIESAIMAVGGDNIDNILTWMDENEELLNRELSAEETTDEPKPGCSRADFPENAANAAENLPDAGAAPVVKSILCEDCGKILRPEDLEFHAMKTSHENYRETSDEAKILTEEDKKKAVKKAELLIKQRRATQAEKKRRDEIEYERNRRKVGQEMASVRQRLEEQERKLVVEARKKEKQEAHLDRLRVLQDIERDKLERQERFRMSATGSSTSDTTQQPLSVESSPLTPPTSHTTCHLQIRLTNGDVLVETFTASEELAAVRLYINMNRTDEPGPFNLRTTYPRRVFQECEMSSTLHDLGLCPKSVIIVTKVLPGQDAGDF